MISDITGVIPDPPAIATRWRLFNASNSVVKLPWGGITSSVAPAFRFSATQLENSPPPILLTVTIQSCSSGAVHSE